jgi:predicted amidohydrolase
VNAIVASCCQVAPALGDPAANRELVADAVSHAAAHGASVVVLPSWSPAAAMASTAEPMPKPARRRQTQDAPLGLRHVSEAWQVAPPLTCARIGQAI